VRPVPCSGPHLPDVLAPAMGHSGELVLVGAIKRMEMRFGRRFDVESLLYGAFLGRPCGRVRTHLHGQANTFRRPPATT
jgi:hypothetical protein